MKFHKFEGGGSWRKFPFRFRGEGSPGGSINSMGVVGAGKFHSDFEGG